ncbi:MAG: hypothetical protein M3Z21_09025 [Pseudomonadota bacterium]|nr:hypothetical protein [Pseudomonadota bacterium]
MAGQRPDLAARVRLISRLYARLRYGPAPAGDGVRRLQRLVRSFRA